ncbi:2-methylcitrate dehydratase [Methanobrevibacter cuticularis]|uniref:2-methylcitrate dehydratase n=1 Tax=Methanobrevibacter cuticularis TaxID=47311 RepID=A0A166DGS0_9EURY|nr:MmgE/PrpD family protein [Methanobrevibacter cuticularis]KZX15582.1 2-methylcitrate dehydratase [Methanobrevibacter cuticularis]
MIVEELAKFLINLKYEDIPEEVINKTKLCFLDFLGVTNRGFHEESSQIALETINQFNQKEGKCSIIGTGYSNENIHSNTHMKANHHANPSSNEYSNSLNAGFLNGISAHALDLDDGHRIAQLHPGCVVFPSALAICEEKNLSGKDFLEAVVCGYEIAIVLGKLVNPSHRNQGFHSTGTIGTFAAGSTVSKLLDFDLEKTIATFGLCGTTAAGLLESDHQGTMGKVLHVGNAVHNGIFSSFLAQKGFSGAESIFDGKEGFLKATSKEDFNEEYLTRYLENELGKFHIREVYFKKYPFCRHLHSSIDATLDIKNKLFNNFNIDDIKRIIIKTYKIAAEHDNFNPKTKEDLKQSLPYSIAIAIISNDMTLENIGNIDFNSYYFKNILEKIVIEIDDEFESLTPDYRPSKVIIEIYSGNDVEIVEKIVKLPLGETENSFSHNDIIEKFRLLNPNFELGRLKSIEKIESYKIRDFMKDLF